MNISPPIDIYFEFDKSRIVRLIQYRIIKEQIQRTAKGFASKPKTIDRFVAIHGFDEQGKEHLINWNQIFSIQLIYHDSAGKRILFNFPDGAIFNRSYLPKQQLKTPHILAF